MSTVRRSDSYKKYKHTYLINIIDKSNEELPIRVESHLDQNYKEMTNMITEVQVNIDYFRNLYYNSGNLEEINKYKYIIMLGLNLEELEVFYERFGDEVMAEYKKALEEVISDEEIMPLFTWKEEQLMEIEAQKDEIKEQAKNDGIKLGTQKRELEIAKVFKEKELILIQYPKQQVFLNKR